MGCEPRFFVALAHTDTVAYFSKVKNPKRLRVSNLNLFPNSMKENLLFSLSFDSAIHYVTMQSSPSLDPMAITEFLSKTPPKRLFADCGAFQFVNSPIPELPDGSKSNANNAWAVYQERHLDKDHLWDEILLCSPDHIICEINAYTKEVEKMLERLSPEDRRKYEDGNPPKKRPLTLGEHRSRMKFNRQEAKDFIKLTKDEQRATPVAVIHGHCDFNKDINTRKKNLTEMIELGYKYVGLGGMVPHSNDKKKALKIIAGIDDLENPVIAKNSILGICRAKGIRLHVFGLTSPDWYRWLYRLRIDSFDGSKLSNEGARNGWYWITKDNKYSGRGLPEKPQSVGDLYDKIAVKEMGAESWKWNLDNGILKPDVPLMSSGVDTSCDCPSCQYLKSARCTSDRCWYWKLNSEHWHVCDPRMMGSTEHNMGRVAHNAHVYSWLVEKIEQLNEMADQTNLEGENEWLKNWATIEVRK